MPFHKVFFRLFLVLITIFFSLSSVRLLSETPFSLNSRQKTRVGLMISRQNAEYSIVISCATFHSGLHIGGGRSRPPWEAAILLVSTKGYIGITLVTSLKVTMQHFFSLQWYLLCVRCTSASVSRKTSYKWTFARRKTIKNSQNQTSRHLGH